MQDWVGSALRWTLRGILALLLVIATALAAATLYLSTDHGRGRLLRAVVSEVNRLLPGTVSARELAQLSPTNVVLRDLSLRAPGGNDVVTLQTARARLAPWSLLDGRVVIEELVLENATVDLRAIDDPRLGLIPALVEPQAEPEPPPEPALGSSEPDVVFEVVRLENCRVRIPTVASWSPDELWVTSLRTRLRVGPGLRLDVQQLLARVNRQAVDIGGIRARGELDTLGPSRFELGGTLAGSELDLHVLFNAPGRELGDWASLPLAIELHAQELTAARLAALTASPALPLLGSYAAQLTLRGTPAALAASGTLQTPGGSISLTGHNREMSRLDVVAQTDRLELRSLAPSLPDRRIATRIAFGLEAATLRAGARAELSARAHVDDVALPLLSLRAEHTEGSPWQLEAKLDDHWLALSGQGQVAADGALRAEARGWLAPKPGLGLVRALGLASGSTLSEILDPDNAGGRLELRVDLSRGAGGELAANAKLASARLELGTGRLEGLAATLSIAGQLPRPRLQVAASWQAARRGSTKLSAGRVAIDGGPRRYRFELQSGLLGFGSLRTSGSIEREGLGQRIEVAASGRYGDAPWQLAIHRALVLDSGNVLLPGVDLELCEQRLHVEGQYAGAASRLVLELRGVDVARVLQPFWPGTDLVGVVRGRVEARGTLERPALSLSLRGSRLGRAHGPTLDARLDAAVDMARGTATLASRARESEESARGRPRRLDVRLDGDAHFEPRRQWPQLLLTGEQRLELDIGALDGALLAELTGGTMPLSVDARGSAALLVRQGVPALDYAIEGRLAWAEEDASAGGGKPPLPPRMKHMLAYDGRRLHTELALDDRRGRWLTFRGDAGLSAERQPTLAALVTNSAEDWLRTLRAASWQVELDAARRPVDVLLAPARLQELRGTELGLQLAAHHEPGTAPAGTLAFQIAEAPRASTRRGCSSHMLTTTGQLAVEAGTFEVALDAFDGGTRRLHASTGGKLDLASWLGGQPPSWAALEIDVEAMQLPLDGLPLLCGRVRGELSGRGTIRDPLGAPQANAELALVGFSLGSEQTVDVNARVSVDAARLALSGEMLAEGRRSPFSILWPRAASDASAAAPDARAISVEFAELPLAPLIPLEGPISHASGYVSGELRAGSNGARRERSGTIRFEQVAFTVTELAQPLSDIQGEISFQNDALVLKRLSGRDGDGELRMNGTLKVNGPRSFDGDFTLVTKKFPLRQAGEVVAQTTATARIEATWRPEQNKMRVALTDFDTWLERIDTSRGMSMDPHPDLKLAARPRLRSGEDVSSTAAALPSKPPTPLFVELDAAQQFWVKRADFALKLSASLQLAAGAAKSDPGQSDVNVTGQLRFDRGYMEMMGKSFEVQRGGTLRFTGGTSAVIDLSAKYADRRSNKLVLVHLQGSADAPKLEFQVDGRKVSAGEAFQAIYGSTASDDDVDPEAQADQIIGALMAGVLTTSMRRKLGSMAPILSVDADDERGEQLRAGFELDALIPGFLRDIVTGVYVEGSVSSEKQADQAGDKDVQTGVLIELHFPYNLVSSGRYGPDTTWSLDIGWQP